MRERALSPGSLTLHSPETQDFYIETAAAKARLPPPDPRGVASIDLLHDATPLPLCPDKALRPVSNLASLRAQGHCTPRMSSWLWLLLAACLFAPIAYGLRRANELFALSARNGTLTITRGRVPQALFSDLAEIVERVRLDNAVIRVLSESGVPRLFLDGATHSAFEQAARNVLGRFSVAQIRAGRLRA